MGRERMQLRYVQCAWSLSIVPKKRGSVGQCSQFALGATTSVSVQYLRYTLPSDVCVVESEACVRRPWFHQLAIVFHLVSLGAAPGYFGYREALERADRTIGDSVSQFRCMNRTSSNQTVLVSWTLT